MASIDGDGIPIRFRGPFQTRPVACSYCVYTQVGYGTGMPHTQHDRRKLLARVTRIQGQIAAVAKLLEQDRHECTAILQTIAAARGALNSLMAEVMAGHIREHVIPAEAKATPEQADAAEQVIDIINSYLR
jgi:DNA-binding FrmR family transcriptional regulator